MAVLFIAGVVATATGGGQPATTPLSQSPGRVPVTASAPHRILVYLVGSEAEKRVLEQDVASSPEWFAETYAGADTSVRILALDRTQEESLEALARLLPEAAIGIGAGPAIKIVDMR